MREIIVVYHYEAPYGWWVDSPAIDGWSASGETLEEAYAMATEGVAFALDTHAVRLTHRLADDVPPPVESAARDEMAGLGRLQAAAESRLQAFGAMVEFAGASDDATEVDGLEIETGPGVLV